MGRKSKASQQIGKPTAAGLQYSNAELARFKQEFAMLLNALAMTACRLESAKKADGQQPEDPQGPSHQSALSRASDLEPEQAGSQPAYRQTRLPPQSAGGMAHLRASGAAADRRGDLATGAGAHCGADAPAGPPDRHREGQSLSDRSHLLRRLLRHHDAEEPRGREGAAPAMPALEKSPRLHASAHLPADGDRAGRGRVRPRAVAGPPAAGPVRRALCQLHQGAGRRLGQAAQAGGPDAGAGEGGA
jgi:hypothetical protein